MSIGIYKIENLINKKIYIGQSVHIERRWAEHCQHSSNSLISQAIQKYGKQNFSFAILQEESDITKLNQLEANYIRQYNSLTPNGYNIVLVDDQQHHQFNKYNQDIFKSIIEDIKNSSMTFKEIASKYDLDLSMIYYLNRGDYHILPDENYPLRPVQDLTKKSWLCIDCQCEIAKGATRCVACDHLRQRKAVRPNRDELKSLIRNIPFTKIGETFGVTDNSIRKWCRNENLPHKSSDIKKYTDEEWEKI